jgi:hypothetical protein
MSAQRAAKPLPRSDGGAQALDSDPRPVVPLISSEDVFATKSDQYFKSDQYLR